MHVTVVAFYISVIPSHPVHHGPLGSVWYCTSHQCCETLFIFCQYLLSIKILWVPQKKASVHNKLLPAFTRETDKVPTRWFVQHGEPSWDYKNILQSPACVISGQFYHLPKTEYYIFPPWVFLIHLQKVLSSHRSCLAFSEIEIWPRAPGSCLSYFPL